LLQHVIGAIIRIVNEHTI